MLPAILAEKRPALSTWRQYQDRLPSEEEVGRWATRTGAVCVVTGRASGNLEMIDFDLGGELFDHWAELVEEEQPGLLGRLVIERSQSGGRHAVYRCQASVSKNLKLAQRIVESPDAGQVTIGGKPYVPRFTDGRWQVVVTLIETRGEGGLFLCHPTPGYDLIQGRLENPPVLTEEERDVLFQAAWSLNEMHRPEDPPVVPASAANRPGDEFNQRGDIRDILQRHGWTLAKPGDNEYWRRPGKTHGWSATLKEGVFYCFSSNAPPFETNQAYSPFAVYSLLEHSGDYAAAASTLRALGYGQEQSESSGVDLSGIMSEMSDPVGEAASTPAPQPRQPKAISIPEELMRVPGFVGEVMEFCLKSARYPSVPLAFCGAMALQSFLCSRKVREEGGLRPNLYILALADSGGGKNQPRKINSYVLGKIGLGGAVGNQIASGQGLEDEILDHRKLLFQTDEIDHLIRSMSSSKESYQSMLLSMLLQLYTEADQVHTERVRAKTRGKPHEARREVDQPGLVLFGTATPDCFYDALSSKLLTNGLFSRSIVLDAGPRGKKQRTLDISQMPDRLLDIALWWKDYNPAPINPQTGKKPDLVDEHPVPAIVPYTDEGYAALDQFADHADNEYAAAMAVGDRVRAILWTRAAENATRLSLVYACSRNHLAPAIDKDVAQWAAAFTTHLVQQMLSEAAMRVAENPFHAECLRLIRTLRSVGGMMSRRELMRVMHCKASDFDQLIGTLIQQAEIAPVEISAKKKSLMGYQLL